MIPITFSDDIIKILFVFVLGTAAMLIFRRTLTALFTVYAIQSLLIALIALVLFARNGSVVLLFVVLLTIASKVVLIPSVLQRVQKNMHLKRDLEFRYLTPISSIVVSAGIIFLVYTTFSRFLLEFSGDHLFFFGAVIGVSLCLIGMLVICTRKTMITKILGYLTMENGVLLFSIFTAELPFIIELLIVLDLVMLIVLATILAFGVDSTIEEFHHKLNSFTLWFKE